MRRRHDDGTAPAGRRGGVRFVEDDRIEFDGVAELGARGRMVLDLGPGRPQLLALWTRRGPYVVENRCPHRPRPLEDAVVKGQALICVGHGRRFSLRCAFGEVEPGQLLRYPAHVEGEVLVVELAGRTGTSSGLRTIDSRL
jgi:nitrite reductase/ring-hydroxylating ferredoxin subunit